MKIIVIITIGVKLKIESDRPVIKPMYIPIKIESLIFPGLFNKAGMHIPISSTHSGIIPNIIFKVNIIVDISIELTIILTHAEVSNFIFIKL